MQMLPGTDVASRQNCKIVLHAEKKFATSQKKKCNKLLSCKDTFNVQEVLSLNSTLFLESIVFFSKTFHDWKIVITLTTAFEMKYIWVVFLEKKNMLCFWICNLVFEERPKCTFWSTNIFSTLVGHYENNHWSTKLVHLFVKLYILYLRFRL